MTASPERFRGDPPVEEPDGLGRGRLGRLPSQRLEQGTGRGGVGLARLPVVADLLDVLEVRLVGADGDGARIVRHVELGERERAEDGLGVLPADRLQGAPALHGVDRLVADVPLVADAVAIERLHDLGRPRIAAERGDGDVGRIGVPGVHRADELGLRPVGPGQVCLVHLGQGPVALLDVLGLRLLEVVERPEQGEQAIGDLGGLAQQVRRVDDHHRVELEADRVGPDVTDAGEEEAREQVAIGEPLLEVGHRDLDCPLSGRLLDPAHHRFDLGAKPDRVRTDLHVGRPSRRDRPQRLPTAHAHAQPQRRGRLQEPTPPELQMSIHRCVPFFVSPGVTVRYDTPRHARGKPTDRRGPQCADDRRGKRLGPLIPHLNGDNAREAAP